MSGFQVLQFAQPDEVREFPNGHIAVCQTEYGTVGQLTLQPGWRWSNDVAPIAGTDWCEAPHLALQLSGTLHVRMRDGSELEIGPGQVAALSAGHDAWVVGNEPVVQVDFHGATSYARAQ